MSSPVKVKRGDIGVTFSDTFTDAEGSPVDLSGATVVFILRRYGATAPTVAEDAEIVVAADGTVRYVTANGDLDVAGIYQQEWEITFGSGDRFTVPSDTHNIVHIGEDLNPEEGS